MNIKSSTKSSLYRIAAIFMIAMLALAALPTTQAFAAPALSVSTITVATQSGTLTYGTIGTATFLVTFTAGNGGSGGINPGVTPSVSGLPTGVTGVFSPSPTGTCFGNGCTVTSTLTLTTTAAAQAVTAASFTVTSGIRTGNGSLTIGKKALTVSGVVANNKVYDHTTAGNGFTGGTLTGIVSPDVVTLTTGTGTFASANVGTGITVTASGFGLAGANAGNYTLSAQPTGLTANITTKGLTVSGVVASNKVYDRTTAGNGFTGGTLTGIISPDVVTLTTGTGTFASANVGTGITVTASGFGLAGANAGNYTLSAQPTGLTANITAKGLTVSGVVANNKVYDRTSAGNGFTGGTLTGIVSPDVVTLSNGIGTFASVNVGTGITVTASGFGLAGADAGNYTLSAQPTGLTANITAKGLTVSGVVANNKVYDRTTIGNGFTGGTLTGIVSPDVVTLTTGTGTFASANVGTGITVTASGFGLAGANAGNYTLSAQPAGLTANITAKGLTVSGVVANNKVYDRTTAGNGFTGGTLTGIVSPDVVTLTTGTGTFASANVGTGITVTASGFDLAGADAGNYTLSAQPTGLTANITAKALSVIANDRSKTYGTAVVFAGTEFTAPALISPDTITSVTLTSTGAASTAAVAGSPYAIAGSGAVGSGLGNYSISYTDGSLTVNPKALTVIANDRSKTYGTAVVFAGTEFTAPALVSPDTITSVSLSSTGAASTATVAGSPYAIVASGAVGTGLGNYTISYTDGSLTVNPKALAVIASNASKSYGDTVTFVGTEFTAPALVSPDSITSVTLTSTGAGSTATVAGSPYTIVPSAAVGSGLGNYTITYTNGSLTVSPAALSVTADNDSKTYDKVSYIGGNGVVYDGFVNSENSSVLGGTLTFGGTSQGSTNVGSFSIVPSGLTSTNYTITFHNGTLTVSPLAITITAQHDNRVYNGTTSSSVAPQTSIALIAPDTATLVQVFNNKNVGTGKTLSAAGSTISDGNGGNNYAVTFVNDTTGAITKYDLEVTAATDIKEYDGDATSAGTPSITLGSLQTGDSAVWTQTFDNKNADTGKTITPAGTVSDGNGGNNYHIVFNTVSSGSITQRAITVTAVTDTKGYDGDATSAGTPTVSSGTIASGDTAAFTQSFENKNVGTGKTLTAAGAISDGNSGNNYVVTFVDNATGEITIRNIEVTAASGNKVYDGTNSSAGVPTITNGSLASGDTATWEQSFDDKNAGNGKTLTATGSISDANGGLNYHISFVTALGNITPADLTVTANDKTIHVGSPTPAFDFAVAGFISPDDFTVIPICSVSGSPTTVGDYAITCASGNAGTNYNIIYVAGTYTITNKVILDVTASSATITYGDADPIITPSYSGFTNGDTVSVLNTAPTCSATGPFTVTGNPFATICSGGDDDKYDFNFINGSITVNPKALTITADNASKTYGSLASFSGSEFTDSGLINSDAIASVTLTSAGSAVTATVGSYNIVPSAATGTGLGNYTITYANGSLTVGPKALVITANNASKNYGATTTFTGTEFSAPALVNSDSVTSVTLTSTGATAIASVGGYNIVPSVAVGTGLGNYTISYVNGTLSVNPATLTVTANNKTIGLGDPDPIFTFAYSGFVNSETATVVTTAPTCTVSGAHNAAGTYPIVCSGGGAANYNFNYVNGTLTVSAVASPINAYIGGSLQGSYFLTAGQSTRVNYAGVDNGPVKVVSTGGNPIISAIRSAWAVNGVTTSFSQLMGLPQEQLSDTYVFPGYNNVTLNDQLRIANVDTAPTSVTVTIGGNVRGTYPLAAGAAVRINYPGLDSGPVVVKGTSGVKIISSIREAWAVNGTTTSFVQLMGLPAGQLSNKYVFPAYNNVTLDEQLRIGNVDPTQSTVVIVTIGGTVRGTYPLGPGQAVRVNYPSLDSGPVIVEGTAGVNIISSIRSAWAVNGVTTSFSQLMGMPVGQLSDKYIFPGYNNVTLDDQLRIANVDTTATSVTVTIGGTVRGTYPLAAGAAVRINYTGLDSGPVVVQGTSGIKIISSIREAWAVNGVTQSFVQLMGLPSQQLSTTYLFPAYNNVTLNEQLRIAVP